MKLAIISHTEHYLKDGQIVGWGPTVREINKLLESFEEIWHVAVLREDQAPLSALPYKSQKIHFIPLKPYGGARFRDKLLILPYVPAVIRIVQDVIRKVDVWQFRAPTGIGVFLIPYLSIFTQKPGWFKYAGNWAQAMPPLGYRWQRFWLSKLQNRPVTINGRWPEQPRHCLSFENPCLDEEERQKGLESLLQKDYTGKLNICFVGHLSAAKGAGVLLDALLHYEGQRINALHLIGDGPLRLSWEEKKRLFPFEVILHGQVSREQVGQIMSECHVIILPSQSEGFPKVIAEGANYGCVPVVSDISSIGQYIRHGENGFLLSPERLGKGLLREDLQTILDLEDLKPLAESAYNMAGAFTFDRYRERIVTEILDN